jgi:hypothetical protein
VADYALIDAYLDDLRATMRWHRGSADVVAEADDHLHSVVERLVAGGAEVEAAQSEALERFGDPVLVARAFASTSRGRLAVPTPSTQGAGTVSVISGCMWLAFPMVWVGAGLLYDKVGPENPGDETGNLAQVALMILIAVSLLGAAGSLFVTLIGLQERHGGFGLVGLVGIVVTGIAVAAALIGWFFLGWGSALVVGTVLVSVAMWRRGLAPRPAVLAIGAGPATGALLWCVLRFATVGSPDQFGDYQIANITGLTVGSVILALGLIGVGRWLTNEDPVSLVNVMNADVNLSTAIWPTMSARESN